MKKDLVSVLMVNYNHADTIEKSIRSVLEQTYSKLQLIIVDDGSTDNSVEIINSIEDPRIELYEQKVNKQICMVTNFGMEKVKGEYFARIDSDDIWKNGRCASRLFTTGTAAIFLNFFIFSDFLQVLISRRSDTG